MTYENSKLSVISVRETIQDTVVNLTPHCLRKIHQVAVNPHAPNINIKTLRGSSILRLRIGDWRVLYTIDNESRTMTVINILPRGRAYR